MECGRKAATSLDEFRLQGACPDVDRVTGPAGISVVFGIGHNLGCENTVSDDVNAEIGSGNVPLELGRTVANIGEAMLLREAQLRNDAAHPAGGLVNHRSVQVTELKCSIRIGG